MFGVYRVRSIAWGSGVLGRLKGLRRKKAKADRVDDATTELGPLQV